MYQDFDDKLKASSDKMVVIEWFFRPEELNGGRQLFHGEDEIFAQNLGGIRPATYSIACVQETCKVLTFSKYNTHRADAKLNALMGGGAGTGAGSTGAGAVGDTAAGCAVYFIRDGKDAPKLPPGKESPKRRTRSDGDNSPKKPRTPTSAATINKRNNKGETKLHTAACRGDSSIVASMIQQRAEVNVSCNAGWTPLHEASLNGHLAVVQTLILGNADLDAQGPGGTTSLHDAVENGHIDIVTALLKAGALTDIKDAEGHVAHQLTQHKDMLDALAQTRSRRRAAQAAAWVIRAQTDLHTL